MASKRSRVDRLEDLAGVSWAAWGREAGHGLTCALRGVQVCSEGEDVARQVGAVFVVFRRAWRAGMTAKERDAAGVDALDALARVLSPDAFAVALACMVYGLPG